MTRDYASIVAALRAKADSTEFDGERQDLLAKADELESEHGPFNQGMFTFVTTLPEPQTHRAGWYQEWLDTLVDESYLYDE